MKKLIQITVNGESFEVAVEPQTTLLETIRGELGLTGTKEACGTGECGSCTVLLEGRPVLSCLALALDCHGKEVVTIEGLAQGQELSTVQKAFHENGAIQCGFCGPGMILSTTALLQSNPDPSDQDINKALEGNLCRCTGYNKILTAVKKAAAASSEK